MSFTLVIARRPQDIVDAQRVRCRVYRDEEGLLPASSCLDAREIDARDYNEDTVHLLIYEGDHPVGTVRLLPACIETLSRRQGRFGLDLESKYDLSALDSRGMVPAEVTRFCVLRRYRGTRVTETLFSGLRGESARRGITHWVAGANMATDFVEDANLACRVIEACHLVSEDVHADPLVAEPPITPRQRPFYTADERANQTSALAQLRLPGPLGLFANKMGARYIGPPVYDAFFGVFALPLVADLERSPAPRLRTI